MNIPLLSQHAQPLKITHHVRWLDLLLEKLRDTPYVVPPLQSERGLRTAVAVLPEQLQAAEQLVRRRYTWRGYEISAGEDAGHAGEGGRGVTLLAQNGAKLLGTLTVRPESPLLAEKTYAAEIERLRSAGHRIGEVVKLAVDAGTEWKAALQALVRSAYLLTHLIHGLTAVVIEVNPRHVRFYDRELGFMVAAPGGVCTRVGAPSVLMQLDLEQFGRRLRSAAG